MILTIIAAILLGSFAILFSIWLIIWSWVMVPMQNAIPKMQDYRTRNILH